MQIEAPLPVAVRIRVIEALAATGVADIEAVAFVSPRAVPAMAGAAEVLAGLRRLDGVRYWALVPNLRGAEMALAALVDGLSVSVSASEVYSGRNVGMTVAESVAQAGLIARAAGAAGDGVPVDAVISCAFGSPYEGEIDPATVAILVRRLRDGGVTAITLADTTGMATPGRIDALLDQTGADVGLHLHDTRGTALLNAFAALSRGVTRFDTSLGGLGGSPFASAGGRAGAAAGGNLATEDLVYLLDDLGISTGVDLARLLAAGDVLAAAVDHRLPSRVAAALSRDP